MIPRRNIRRAATAHHRTKRTEEKSFFFCVELNLGADVGEMVTDFRNNEVPGPYFPNGFPLSWIPESF